MYYISFSALKRKTNVFLSVNYSDENRLRMGYSNNYKKKNCDKILISFDKSYQLDMSPFVWLKIIPFRYVTLSVSLVWQIR